MKHNPRHETKKIYKINGEREKERRVFQIKQAQLNHQNGLSD